MLVFRIAAGQADVFLDRTVEQEVVLRHKADDIRKLRQRNILDVCAANERSYKQSLVGAFQRASTASCT